MLRFFSTLTFVVGLSIAASTAAFAVGSSSGGSGSGSSGSSSSGSSYGSSSSSGSSGGSSRSDGNGATQAPDIDEMMARARKYVERGWYRRAAGLLRQVTILDPFNADAWNEMGFAYRNVENYNQSARAYDRALSLEPDHLGALNYQGFMFLELSDPASARNNLARLGELCGSCSEFQSLKDAIDAL